MASASATVNHCAASISGKTGAGRCAEATRSRSNCSRSRQCRDPARARSLRRSFHRPAGAAPLERASLATPCQALLELRARPPPPCFRRLQYLPSESARHHDRAGANRVRRDGRARPPSSRLSADKAISRRFEPSSAAASIRSPNHRIDLLGPRGTAGQALQNGNASFAPRPHAGSTYFAPCPFRPVSGHAQDEGGQYGFA